MKLATCSLVLCLVLGPFAAGFASGSFRCGGHIVEMGMSLDKVREYCGAPTRETGDRWIYDRGSEELIVIIHVEPDNTVGAIEEKRRE
jgi:hypothetical protein